MAKTYHFKKYSLVEGGIHVNLDLTRFDEQLQRAQYYLDSQVMNDMVPFMPMQTGTLINNTRARSAAMAGTGKVCAAAPPYGRFQYMGKVMIDPVTGSPWARKGAKKIVTDRPLTYSNPRAVPFWFDEAKKTSSAKWIKGVKQRAGGEKTS